MGSNNKQKTTNDFFKEVKEKSNGHIILIGEYKNNKTETEFLCTETNTKFSRKPNYLTDKRCNFSCPICSGKVKKTLNDFLSEIDENTNGRFKYIRGEFKNNKSRLVFYDNELKKEITSDCDKLLMKYRKIENIEEYFNSEKHITFVKSLEKHPLYNEFTFVTPYINSERPIIIRHNCGRELTRSPKALKDTMTCPTCNNSHNSAPVQGIQNYLESKNIFYEREFRDKLCKNKNELPFDFYIPELDLLLEYDGGQHERGYKGDLEELEITKLRDSIKNSFVESGNMYNLVRITENDIKEIPLEEILDKIFVDKIVPENIFSILCSSKTTLIAGNS